MKTRLPWSIAALLSRAVRERHDAIFVVDGDARFTAAELAHRAGSLARALETRGLCAGDRVAILAPNSHEYIEAYFAAAALGAVLVPIDTRLLCREVRAILNDSEAKALICALPHRTVALEALSEGDTAVERVLWMGGACAEPFALAPIAEREYEEALAADATFFEPVAVDPDAPAHLCYTSGTAFAPEGFALTHRDLSARAARAIDELGLHEGDVLGHFAPMFDSVGAWATFAVTAVLGRHVMCGKFGGFEALRLVAAHGITISSLTPAMLDEMVRCGDVGDYDLSRLRLLLSDGSPISGGLERLIDARLGKENGE